MTREQIIELVNEKQMHGGFLTSDDYYEIGLAHKQLLKAERSWDWLNEITGHYFSSGESYRNFVKFRIKKSGKVSENVETGDDFTRKKQELYKERQLLRDERTALNALLRDEARVERFKQEVIEEARKAPKLPEVRYSGKSFNGKIEAVALLSDIHLGMQIDGFVNTYNLEIAQKRLDKWTQDVIRYCTANKVTRLNIVNLGDMIAGEIHPSIRIMQEIDAAEQVMKAGELIARTLNKLQEAAPEVYYRSVSDNHGRFQADTHQSIERENFFRLIDWWVEPRLENTRINFPKDNINFRTGKFRLMNGKLCMFEHGHKLKPNTSFQSLIGMVEEYVHYVFIAHYHEEKVKMFQNMRVIVNGSMCGTDPYADDIHKYTKPKQTLLIFDDDTIINFSIDLDIRQ